MSETRRSLGRPGLYVIAVVGVYLTYLVLRPFLVALTWAVMFAVLFHGMQAVLVRRMTPGRAAGLTTAVVGIAIVLPVVVLVATVAREAPQITDRVKETSQTAPGQIQLVWDKVRAKSPVAIPEDPAEIIAKGQQRAMTFLTSRATGLVTDSLATLGNLGVMLFALFFFLRDGDKLGKQLRDRLPLSEPDSERLLTQTRDLVTASFGAGAVVAAAQGTIGGLAFWLAGIHTPVFWGIVMAFASILPVAGASLIWLPAGIWLLLSGAIGRGVFLLLIGVFGISMADNVLRPMLLTGKTSLSGFVIFFGLLGGAAAFGLIGLVIGPIILVITAQLLDFLRRPTIPNETKIAETKVAETTPPKRGLFTARTSR